MMDILPPRLQRTMMGIRRRARQSDIDRLKISGSRYSYFYEMIWPNCYWQDIKNEYVSFVETSAIAFVISRNLKSGEIERGASAEKIGKQIIEDLQAQGYLDENSNVTSDGRSKIEELKRLDNSAFFMKKIWKERIPVALAIMSVLAFLFAFLEFFFGFNNISQLIKQ